MILAQTKMRVMRIMSLMAKKVKAMGNGRGDTAQGDSVEEPMRPAKGRESKEMGQTEEDERALNVRVI